MRDAQSPQQFEALCVHLTADEDVRQELDWVRTATWQVVADDAPQPVMVEFIVLGHVEPRHPANTSKEGAAWKQNNHRAIISMKSIITNITWHHLSWDQHWNGNVLLMIFVLLADFHNFCFSQWWKFCQNGNFSVSVNIEPPSFQCVPCYNLTGLFSSSLIKVTHYTSNAILSIKINVLSRYFCCWGRNIPGEVDQYTVNSLI